MQLSYAHGTGDVPLLGETIGRNLRRTAERVPDAPALVSRRQDVRLTYAQFEAEVDRAARALIAAGLAKGDRLGVWSPNRSEWTILQYATARAGVILVNMNPAYRTHELEFVLNQAGVRLLVAARSFKSSMYAEMIETVRPDTPQLEQVVITDTEQWAALFVHDGDMARVRDRQHELSADDAINIQYTSGTTGFPKGATLSHHNILNNGYFVGRLCGYTDLDRVCIHRAASTTSAVFSGSSQYPSITE